MTYNYMNAWAFFGAAAGAGFGLFAMPLLYLLVQNFYGGATLFETIKFAIGNGIAWGFLGFLAGIFASFINEVTNPPSE